MQYKKLSPTRCFPRLCHSLYSFQSKRPLPTTKTILPKRITNECGFRPQYPCPSPVVPSPSPCSCVLPAPLSFTLSSLPSRRSRFRLFFAAGCVFPIAVELRASKFCVVEFCSMHPLEGKNRLTMRVQVRASIKISYTRVVFTVIPLLNVACFLLLLTVGVFVWGSWGILQDLFLPMGR